MSRILPFVVLGVWGVCVATFAAVLPFSENHTATTRTWLQKQEASSSCSVQHETVSPWLVGVLLLGVLDVFQVQHVLVTPEAYIVPYITPLRSLDHRSY